MKHHYHVYTPVSRPKNMPALIKMLGEEGVTWHPVFDREADVSQLWMPWIDPMFCPPITPGWFAGHYVANWFLDHVDWRDDDRYAILNDDDFYEPGFFRKIDAVEGDVLICSMKRGDASPPKSDTPAQPCHTLIAAKENLSCGGIGGEQIVATGAAHRNYRYGPGFSGDWDMISAMLSDHEPTFVPEAFVWFNYLEPGRWKGGPQT